MWWLRKERQQRDTAETDRASNHGGLGGGGGGNSNLSRSDTTRTAYGVIDTSNNNTFNGTGTVSSMGTGTYAVTGNPAMVRRTSSDWDVSPVGRAVGHYQMAEIDGKEKLVMPPQQPETRKKSMYELP
ncbi:hypothetical protein LZ30DRAFT_702875 [Colletotrichum cereale]|nr:hypothetical protein LZ30DRAFT_702875 [Colletotrichum cereale]